jgi:hypothetical protein
MDPHLKEGIHYSVMFYGGKLLSHLSGSDPKVTEVEPPHELEEFISLRRLNRNMAHLIDSDRSSPKKEVNATKQRLVKEFEQGPGFAWVTAGRTIENYIPPDILDAAVRAVHHPADRAAVPGRYSEVFGPEVYPAKGRGKGACLRVDKVAVAKEVVKAHPPLTVIDLSNRMLQAVAFIRRANGFPVLEATTPFQE